MISRPDRPLSLSLNYQCSFLNLASSIDIGDQGLPQIENRRQTPQTISIMLRDPRTAASVKLQRDIKEDLDWQLRAGHVDAIVIDTRGGQRPFAILHEVLAAETNRLFAALRRV